MNVTLAESAVRDLENIKSYIAQDSEFYANVVIEKIFKSIRLLGDYPEIGRKDSKLKGDNLRVLVSQNYRIIYRKEQCGIIVMAVVHGKREIENYSPY